MTHDAGKPRGRHIPPPSPGREIATQLYVLDNHRHAVEQRRRIGNADIRLLWLLGDGRPRSLKEITEAMGRDQSTVNRQVNAALREGIVTRSRTSGRYLISSTSEGDDLLEREQSHSLDLYGRALAALGDDAPRLLELFDRFVDAYGRAARDGQPGEAGQAYTPAE